MSITDKQMEAAFKTIRCCPSQMFTPALRKAIEAAMQAAPSIEQEPVGRVVNISYPESDDNTKYLTATITDASRCKAGDYLYTTPQPKREPLSDDELNSLRQRDNGKLNFVTLIEFREIAKVIEKTHGIGTE